MNPDDDRLLQDIVCGDADERDPAVSARLAADPRLRDRLAALRAAQREFAELAQCSAALVEEAAGFVAPGDRDRVRTALTAPIGWRRARRARWLAVVGLAATVAVAALVMFGRSGDGEPAGDGPLGVAEGVALQRDGDRWILQVDATLPPGTTYRVRLELADGSSSTESAATTEWPFPDAWNRSVRDASPARLVVEWDDGTGLFVRRVLSLP